MTTPPRWDLSNIYLSLDDPALAADIEDVKKTIQEAAQAFETEYLPLLDPDSSSEALNHVLNDFVNTNNALSLKAGRIFAYLGATVGRAIPDSVPLDFAVPITFLAMIAPALRSLPHLVAATVAVIVSLLLVGLPAGVGPMIAAILAMLAGSAAEVWQVRRTGGRA